MRVIGGRLGGRVFRSGPARAGTLRPTTDRAREGLMNLLSTRIELEGASVADFFSGTGAIALELASRGAGSVLSVEVQGSLVAAQKALFKEAGISEVTVLRADAMKFLRQPYGGPLCSLVFADPPYELPALETLPERLLSWAGTAPGALVVLEHRSRYDFSPHPAFVESRAYGEATFSMFTEEPAHFG